MVDKTIILFGRDNTVKQIIAVAAATVCAIIIMFFIGGGITKADADLNIQPDQIDVIVMPAEPMPNLVITQSGRFLVVPPTYQQQYPVAEERTETKSNESKPKEETNNAVSVPADVPVPDTEKKEEEEEITPLESLPVEILILTNNEREKEGLGTLTYYSELQEAADLRAKECATSFSHTRPDGSSCFSVLPKDYEVAGENLIMADGPLANAETMMSTWMNSEGHRANILLPEFTTLTVGVYESEGTVYAVQIFTRPAS